MTRTATRAPHVRAQACLLVLAVVLGIPGGAPAQTDKRLDSEEQITIRKEGLSRIHLLLEEFAPGAGATARDTGPVQETVARDLDFSDLFTVLKISHLDPDGAVPEGEGRALVRADVLVTGGDLVLRGRLESLPDRGLVFSRDYRTRPEWFREAAHRFADDIVLYLTGRPGISRTRIAFISDRSRNKEVCVVDYDGFGTKQVSQDGTITLSPDWAADGREIAFVSFRSGNADLHLLDLTTGKNRVFVSGPGVQASPAYSPDGTQIAFSHTEGRASDIYVCSRNGKNRRRVTRSPGINTSPSWSPDGRRLVFTSDRSGTPQLYVVDAEGGSPRRITFEGKWNDLADWSPAGDRIVYCSMRDGLFRVCVVDPTGLGEERQLTFGPGSDEHPRWAPDGRHLVFTSNRGGAKGLYVLDADLGRVRPLDVGGGNNSSPAWSGIPAR